MRYICLKLLYDYVREMLHGDLGINIVGRGKNMNLNSY